MKKIMSVFLVLMIFLFSSAFTFSDLNDNYSWAEEAINYLYNEKIIEGYEDGSFRPDNNITNAEVAKILYGVFGSYEENYTYSDVLEDSWYGKYVEAMGGCFIRDNEFYPDASSKRKEIAYAVCALKGFDISSQISDASEGEEKKYENAVLYLKNIGILKGYEDESLRPESNVTRAEFAVIIKRTLDYKLHEEENVETEALEKEEEKPSSEEKEVVSQNYFFVVTEVATALNEKGDICQKISGYNGGAFEEFFVDDSVKKGSSGYNTSTIKKNDVLFVFKDYFGNVKQIANIANIESLKISSAQIDIYVLNGKNEYLYGKAEKIVNDKILEISGVNVLNVPCEISYRISDNAKYYVYKNGEIKTGDILDIEDNTFSGNGDHVLCHAYDEIIENVLIIK